MITRVVNVKTSPYDVYIGRQMRGYPFGKWGNPYRVGSLYVLAGGRQRKITRDDAIRLYRWYLYKNLERMPDYLEPLRGKVLGCWCAPLACHGDVIAEALYGSTEHR